MKKFLARFAVLGLFAGLVATSYSMPARAAVSDQSTSYSGVTAPAESAAASEIYIFYDENYLFIFIFDLEAAGAQSGTLAGGLSDRAFDAH